MKAIMTFFVSLILVMSPVLASAAFADDNTLPQKDNDWFKHAQSTLSEKIRQVPNTNPAKNIILMIADGNGVGSNYAIRLFRGQSAGDTGMNMSSPMRRCHTLPL